MHQSIMRNRILLLVVTWTMFPFAAVVLAQELPNPTEKLATLELFAARRPSVYLTVFNNGYTGDPLPHDPADFERLVRTIKEEGHFNVILCKWTAEREVICRKYGIYMMVDLLADEHHLYRPETWQNAKALCERLRNNPTVVAYHLWSDRIGPSGAGRTRDIRNVQTWDPTTPTFAGGYQSRGIGSLAESDFVSYYDFSWKRGPHRNFGNLLAAWRTASINDGRLGRYVETDAGRPGAGNAARMQYIQITSIACGLRTTLFFIGSRIMNMHTFELNQYGRDVARVNAYIAPMRHEIAKLGLPYAIYSTPWTIDFNNRPVPGADEQTVYPPALEDHAFPADFWIQPVTGEFVIGVSKYAGSDKDVVFIANHNAYAPQTVTLRITRPDATAKIFNHQTRRYDTMPVTDATVTFQLDPAGGTIIIFKCPTTRAGT
jgi:hypothetical protein